MVQNWGDIGRGTTLPRLRIRRVTLGVVLSCRSVISLPFMPHDLSLLRRH